MSIESFDKLLALVGSRITYENTRLRLSVVIARLCDLHYSQLLTICSFVYEIKTVMQRLVFSLGPR